jgi:hypothetical protein
MDELLMDQFNVIARWQAKRYGLTDDQLRRKLGAGGLWQKILPGIYVAATGMATIEQRQMAALLYAGPGAVLTGAAAVRRHKLACAGGNDVEVLVPVSSHVKGHAYVRIRRTKRMPSGSLSMRNLVFAPLARAVGDAARAMLKPEEVRALVSEALQKGFCLTLDDLINELRAGPAVGSGLFKTALAELASGVRYEAEWELRACIERSDLPRPVYNARLYLPDGTFLAMTDAWWPCNSCLRTSSPSGPPTTRRSIVRSRTGRRVLRRVSSSVARSTAAIAQSRSARALRLRNRVAPSRDCFRCPLARY